MDKIKAFLDKPKFSIIMFGFLTLFYISSLTIPNNTLRVLTTLSYLIYFGFSFKFNILRIFKIPIFLLITMFASYFIGKNNELLGVLFSTAVSIYFSSMFVIEMSKIKGWFKNWYSEVLVLTYFLIVVVVSIFTTVTPILALSIGIFYIVLSPIVSYLSKI